MPKKHTQSTDEDGLPKITPPLTLEEEDRIWKKQGILVYGTLFSIIFFPTLISTYYVEPDHSFGMRVAIAFLACVLFSPFWIMLGNWIMQGLFYLGEYRYERQNQRETLAWEIALKAKNWRSVIEKLEDYDEQLRKGWFKKGDVIDGHYGKMQERWLGEEEGVGILITLYRMQKEGSVEQGGYRDQLRLRLEERTLGFEEVYNALNMLYALKQEGLMEPGDDADRYRECLVEALNKDDAFYYVDHIMEQQRKRQIKEGHHLEEMREVLEKRWLDERDLKDLARPWFMSYAPFRWL